jgi:prevent-host-death family protein
MYHVARPVLVGTRELKTRLGEYLRRVRAGHRLVITDRGEPVAELRPLDRGANEAITLDRLRALGTVTRVESRPLATIRPLDASGPSLSRAIVEDRQDRV